MRRATPGLSTHSLGSPPSPAPPEPPLPETPELPAPPTPVPVPPLDPPEGPPTSFERCDDSPHPNWQITRAKTFNFSPRPPVRNWFQVLPSGRYLPASEQPPI